MTKTELANLVRLLSDDKVEPYLFSDKDLFRTITEAEREASERALFLRLDSDFNINVLPTIANYELDPVIIFIDSAKLVSGFRPLIKTTRRELDFNINNWATETGTPKYYFQNYLTLTLYPIPDAAFTLMLDGSRRPQEELEIPEQYHEALANWCLYRFYSIHDADLGNVQLAQTHLDMFTKLFGHKRSAQFDTVHRAVSEISSLYRSPFQ